MANSARRERFRWLVGRAAWALVAFVALRSPASAVQLTACGETQAPECAGVCPEGQRCLPVLAEIFIVIVEGQDKSEPASKGNVPQAECACIEAVCGGVTLADGQGCCNGVPFTIGVQGCCNGTVQDVNEPCDCTDDLTEAGCCSIEFDGGSQIVEYSAHAAACCQHSLTVGGIPATSITAYTLNAGVDCCGAAGAPRVCGGTCEGSECATTGCCTCGDCDVADVPFCAAADTELGCAAACFLEGICFEDLARFENGVCSESGACQVTDPAQAPAVSHGGLFAAVGLLMLVAAGAFARRRLASPR
jgi:hypothetical protein